ncbi:hypothetical protein ACROYT_G012466 [Oculina patagonica]
MRTPMNYLLVNLAVADIFYAAFIAPGVYLSLTSTHPEGVVGTVLCKLLTGGTVAWTGAASSIVTLVVIALERYYAVVYPLGNKGKFSKRKLKMIILGSWIFSFIFCFPMLLIKNVKANACVKTWPGQEWLIKSYHWMWTVLIVISLALMVGFYSRVVYTLWCKGNDENQLTNQQRGVIRVRKRVTLMVVTVTAIFGICWLTDEIVHLVDAFLSYSIDKDVYTVTHTMILFSSAANPFVYSLTNKNFREKIKGIICCARSTAVIQPPHSTELSNVTDSTHAAGPYFRE